MIAVRRILVPAIGLIPAIAIAGAAKLSPEQFGPVKFGAPIEEVERTLGERAEPAERDPQCQFVTFRTFPNARFMVEAGKVTRADSKGPVATSTKIRLGMTLSQAREAEPKAQVEPHHYADGGHYLSLQDKDGRFSILFEEFGGRVQEVRAGFASSVRYVEGCL